MSLDDIKNETYELAIIGGGPAGLSAALYAGRYKLNTFVFTDSFGGNASQAHKICNYPGFNEISGMELINNFISQVKNLGIEIVFEKVVDIKKENDLFVVSSDRRTIKAKKILLAVGSSRRKLNLEKEDFFLGKGVSYCATCDANFYKNKKVAVIGGGNSAVTAALMLADLTSEVFLIYRKNKLKAEPMWVDLAEKNKNIKILYNLEVKELIGTNALEKIKLNNNEEIDVDGLFIEVGSVPNTELLDKINVNVNSEKYIVVDKEQRTNVDGVFSAGDCTNSSDLKQIVTAVSQGAIAAYNIYKDIKKD